MKTLNNSSRKLRITRKLIYFGGVILIVVLQLINVSQLAGAKR